MTEQDEGTADSKRCPCGEAAVDTLYLSASVTKCSECGTERQEQVAVPVCMVHLGDHASGALDGRLLLAASAVRDPELARSVMTTTQPFATRLAAVHDHGVLVGYELQETD